MIGSNFNEIEETGRPTKAVVLPLKATPYRQICPGYRAGYCDKADDEVLIVGDYCDVQ